MRRLSFALAFTLLFVLAGGGCADTTDKGEKVRGVPKELLSQIPQPTPENPDAAEGLGFEQPQKLLPPVTGIGCGPNGYIRSSCLAPIAGGHLLKNAAAAWNAMNARAPPVCGVRLFPMGSLSSYRDYAGQVFLYRRSRPGWAAYPGTSNHGWGVAVDLGSRAMRSCIDRIGSKYGWAKRCSDASFEWWHIKFNPACTGASYRPHPPFCRKGVKVGRHCRKVLRRGSHGPGVRRIQRALRNEGWCSTRVNGTFGRTTERNVKRFQRKRAHVTPDGVAGRKTWLAIERYRGGASRC